MANEIYLPISNPIKWMEVDPAELPQYLTKHFDDYWQKEQLRDWETQVYYKQKWQTSDAVYEQYESNFAAIQLDVLDCSGVSVLTLPATQVRENLNLPGFYIYELTLSWAAFDPGTYYLKLTLGDGTTVMVSEPQEIAETWPNTILFEYYNSTFHGDVVYETGIQFGLRCEAFINRLEPGNERTAYRDQKQNPTILKSVPFRGFKLEIGHFTGIPDWMIDKLNWVWSCDNVLCDGKSFAVAEGGQFEETEVEKIYPFRMWTLPIQEGVNRYSKIVNPELNPNKKIIIAGLIDATIFGDLTDVGSNLVPIENIG